MNKTPNAQRVHIAILGKRNAGKSSLLNAILGQEVSLVSDIKGTTTDPVNKAMEIIGLGPVLFIDTAGIDDGGALGTLRVGKTLEVLQKTDLAIYVMDSQDIDMEYLEKANTYFKNLNIPYIVAINKIDTIQPEKLTALRKEFPQACFVSSKDEGSMGPLKDVIIHKLQGETEETPLIGDLIPYDGKVVIVVSIDSEAPKGRLILPQVQVIRDCLDHGIKSYVVRDTELQSALKDMKDVDLVVTDSQIFKKVEKIVPPTIKLTSFSILFARYKGDLKVYTEGIQAINNLQNGSNILICESCSHNHSHEDIGRVKIPTMLSKCTNKELNYYFSTGQDFDRHIEKYDLIIHCGSCMVNKKSMETRIQMCQEKNIPITNYGVLLAYFSNILERTLEIFT